MGGDGYYPEYYLRKRKRDQLYTNLTRIFISLLVFGGLGVLCGFLGFHYLWQPKHTVPGVTKEMAADRQAIGTTQKVEQSAQQRAQQAQLATPPPVSVQYRPVDLSAIPYSDTSFPMTSVALQPHDGASTPANAGAAPGEAKGPAGANTAAPDVSESGGTFQPPPAPPASGLPPGAATDTSPIPGLHSPPPPASTKAADDAAKLAAKKAADKKAADQKKADAAAAAAKAKEDAKATAPKDAKAAVQPSKTIYHVYGGRTATKDQADALKRDLQGQGYAGTLIKSGGDYLVLVATLDELDKAAALSEELQKRGFQPFSTRSRVQAP